MRKFKAGFFFAAMCLLLVAVTLPAAAAGRLPRIVIECQYDDARDFHEGLAAVRQGDTWGYIDNLGHVQLSLIHRVPEAGPFSGGVAFVGNRYINVEGQPAFGDRLFERGLPFSQGLAAVQTEGKWGFIDQAGRFVIAPIYEGAGSFSEEGLAPVRQGALWGYIDKTGIMKLSPQFLRAGPFSEGLAVVEVRGRFGYIDPTGIFHIKTDLYDAGDFKYGLAPVKRAGSYRAWGFIDKEGHLAIPYRYNMAGPFSDGGLAPAATDSRWGFINVRGENALPNLYDEVRPFSEGLAAVRIDNKWGYIRQ